MCSKGRSLRPITLRNSNLIWRLNHNDLHYFVMESPGQEALLAIVFTHFRTPQRFF